MIFAHVCVASIHSELYNLIRDVYYASFIKSDYVSIATQMRATLSFSATIDAAVYIIDVRQPDRTEATRFGALVALQSVAQSADEQRRDQSSGRRVHNGRRL